MEWYPPPAMLEHGPRSAGVSHCPNPQSSPQHRTIPSLWSAMMWRCPDATLAQAPRSIGTSEIKPQHRTIPSPHALCSTATTPAVARNAVTRLVRVRSGLVRPVCFDCAIATKGTTVSTRSQQQSRARRGSSGFSCIHRLALAPIRARGGLGAVPHFAAFPLDLQTNHKHPRRFYPTPRSPRTLRG